MTKFQIRESVCMVRIYVRAEVEMTALMKFFKCDFTGANELIACMRSVCGRYTNVTTAALQSVTML